MRARKHAEGVIQSATARNELRVYAESGRRGAFVGRRSRVSSSSALRASSCSASPRARETRSTTSHVGLAAPRSSPRIEVASRFAASARASWVRPTSSRRRRIARPRATWGVWLIRTPEPSALEPAMTREQVPGRVLEPPVPQRRPPCRVPIPYPSFRNLADSKNRPGSGAGTLHEPFVRGFNTVPRRYGRATGSASSPA
jgi:hypothetical protein